MTFNLNVYTTYILTDTVIESNLKNLRVRTEFRHSNLKSEKLGFSQTDVRVEVG